MTVCQKVNKNYIKSKSYLVVQAASLSEECNTGARYDHPINCELKYRV